MPGARPRRGRPVRKRGPDPPGNGTRLASAATRPTQREPPRDPAAAVAGTVGVGSNPSPHLRLWPSDPPLSPSTRCRYSAAMLKKRSPDLDSLRLLEERL